MNELQYSFHYHTNFVLNTHWRNTIYFHWTRSVCELTYLLFSSSEDRAIAGKMSVRSLKHFRILRLLWCRSSCRRSLWTLYSMHYYSKRILVCLWSPPRLSRPLRPCFRFSFARFSQQPWRRSDKSFPAFQGSSTSHVVWTYRADAWYESADLLQFLVFEKERVKWWLK